jgi:5-methyltetrahydrofolate--homocysteine methyltransferase
MKIIAEKINGTRKRVAKAIEERDSSYIQNLAKTQADAGADWLDVNAGTHPSQELEDLLWLIEQIQAVVDTPLSLDSPNPKALDVAIKTVKKTPLINSISGEPERLTGILPLAAQHGCPVIALAMDGKRIPPTSELRMEVIRMVMVETRAAGIADKDVYVDALALTIGTDTGSALVTLETIRRIKSEFPDAHITLGLSNVSFGMPARSNISRTFLTLAMQAGLDCAILDPLDRQLQGAILTTELLLGQDRHCLNYLRAARKGLLG